MIVKNDKEFYPLSICEMRMDGKIYYDRSRREKSWFYLALEAERQESNADSQGE